MAKVDIDRKIGGCTADQDFILTGRINFTFHSSEIEDQEYMELFTVCYKFTSS